MKYLALAAFLLSAGGNAATVYTCTDSKGKKTFSQRPCSSSAQIIQVEGPQALGSVAPDKQALNTLSASNDLKQVNRNIAAKHDYISELEKKLELEIALLRKKASYANNNLAGATWEQSIAADMEATNQRYRTKIGLAQSQLKRLYRKKEELEEVLQKGG